MHQHLTPEQIGVHAEIRAAAKARFGSDAKCLFLVHDHDGEAALTASIAVDTNPYGCVILAGTHTQSGDTLASFLAQALAKIAELPTDLLGAKAEDHNRAAQDALDADDVCGLCGERGADKIPAPRQWPGEREPDSRLVHDYCETAECSRAHAALSQGQRDAVIDGMRAA